MSKSDVKRIQTTLEVVTDNLDDLVNELLPDNVDAKELVNHLYEVINDVCSILENEIAEDQAAKLFDVANEKKALRQKYEDLITNLSPMVEVVVDEGY
jgi:hypothetical protein